MGDIGPYISRSHVGRKYEQNRGEHATGYMATGHACFTV